MGRYIKLDENNKITSIRIGKTIVDGEIESNIGELGQIKQLDGSFIDDATQQETIITIEEKIDTLQNTVDLLLLRQEGII